MSDVWDSCVIGDVVEQVRRQESVEPDREYPLLGVRWYGKGAFHRETVTSETAKAKAYFVVHADEFIYNRLFAWKGSFGVIPSELSGYFVSGEFPIFLTDHERLLPSYLLLVMSQPEVWEQIERESTGSTSTSRNRWKEERFLTFPLLLPSLAEQRRIVDLVASIDLRIQAASDLEESLISLRSSLREEASPDSQEVTVGEIVLDIEAGKSPVAEDRLPRDGERAVLKVSAVRFGYFDPDEVKTLPATAHFPESARLQEGDVLMTRANTTQLVGAVCRVRHAPANYFLCDKSLRLIPDETKVDPDYLVEALQSRRAREQIEVRATGTSGSMKNISQATIRSLRVQLPPLEQQVSISETSLAAEDVRSRVVAERQCLVDVRSAIVATLLSGSHGIPSSYDLLLDA